MRLLGLIIVLLILAIGGLTGYAYLGDMNAAPKEMRVPVQLDLGAATPTEGTTTQTSPAAEATTGTDAAAEGTDQPPAESEAPAAAPEQTNDLD
ncbi:hypothetical protein [Paracoccus sp. (in: a-proteobacteria)]|uniref:hypothetical protein n=1 Tax=Paracoccus sp. TaxID=267 RepID=UPI00289D6AF6|nr:hypothetical protein [Paracoccus sp. (in: a-proteobacteria)]